MRSIEYILKEYLVMRDLNLWDIFFSKTHPTFDCIKVLVQKKLAERSCIAKKLAGADWALTTNTLGYGILWLKEADDLSVLKWK